MRVIILLAVVAAGYFVVSSFGSTLLSQRLSQDEQRVRDQIDRLQEQQQELEALRDYLQTNDYVEGVARRVLGLVRPGETLYIVSSDAPANPEPTPAGDSDGSPEAWWERLYGQ